MVIQVQPDTTNEKEFVRIEEAATIFGVSRATMYEWITRYKIQRYGDELNKGVKYVKPAEIRAARNAAAQIRPMDGGEE